MLRARRYCIFIAGFTGEKVTDAAVKSRRAGLEKKSGTVPEWVRKKSADAPKREEIEALDKEFIRQNLSPGGAADLLAAALFCETIKCV